MGKYLRPKWLSPGGAAVVNTKVADRMDSARDDISCTAAAALSGIDFASRSDWGSPFRHNQTFTDTQAKYKTLMLRNMLQSQRNNACNQFVTEFMEVIGERLKRNSIWHFKLFCKQERKKKYCAEQMKFKIAFEWFTKSDDRGMRRSSKQSWAKWREDSTRGRLVADIWVRWCKSAINPRELKPFKRERLQKLYMRSRISAAFEALNSENYDDLIEALGNGPSSGQQNLLEGACARHLQKLWRGYNVRKRLQQIQHNRNFGEGKEAAPGASKNGLGLHGWRLRPCKVGQLYNPSQPPVTSFHPPSPPSGDT